MREDLAAPEDRLREWMRALDEIVKSKSAAKIVTKIPLIPGLLEYQQDVAIEFRWNKWVEWLRVAIRKR